MDENTRRALRDIANTRAILPPGALQREVSKALTARQEAMNSLAAYRQFKAPWPNAHPVIDPRALERFADIRQEVFRTALGGLKEEQRNAIQSAVADIQKPVPARGLGSVLPDQGLGRVLPDQGLGRVLQDTEAIRRITEPIRQNWLQSALRDAQFVLRSPEVQDMFVDMESVRDLLEQAEAMETDAGDVQAELPENLDLEIFLNLNIHTLVFIIDYFNSVLTVLVVALTVATFGTEQSQMITNIEDACLIAKGITELSLRALERKASDQNID